MLDPFTLHDGVLELDEGKGAWDGPRIVDPAAGLIRYKVGDKTIPVVDLRAVAVVYVERDLMSGLGTRGKARLRKMMIHSVVLVPQRLAPDVAALFDAIAAQRDPGAGWSVRGASLSVDQASVLFCNSGSALAARRTAKTIARMTKLPLVELYGEGYVYRAADKLDQTLGQTLAEAPPGMPGPAPSGLAISEEANTLRVGFVKPPPPTKIWVLLGIACAPITLPLLWIAPVVGAIGLAFVASALFLVLRARKSSSSHLLVGRDHIEWQVDGKAESVEVHTLERVRLNESTLVLVTHMDELRCIFPSPECSAWTRRAIEHQLFQRGDAAYR